MAGTPIVTFWEGQLLPRLHLVCVSSWLHVGHDVHVYGYRKPDNLPNGAQFVDASLVLSQEHAFYNKNAGNIAQFADIFRMELLRRNLGTWLDADLLLLRPIPEDRAVILAWERYGHICNAAMRFPENHEIPKAVVRAFSTKTLGPWALAKPRFKKLLKWFAGQKITQTDLPLGHWGRHPLGYFVRKLHMEKDLLGQNSFYHSSTYDGSLFQAVPYDHLMDDDEVLGVHFFFKDADFDNPVPGSFFAHMCGRYDSRG